MRPNPRHHAATTRMPTVCPRHLEYSSLSFFSRERALELAANLWKEMTSHSTGVRLELAANLWKEMTSHPTGVRLELAANLWKEMKSHSTGVRLCPFRRFAAHRRALWREVALKDAKRQRKMGRDAGDATGVVCSEVK